MLFNFSNLIQNYKLNIKGAIQVGAHYGQEIEDFLKNNITNIICFEPCPEAFEKLKTNSINKALIFNFALGNDNKIVKMYVEKNNEGMSNSILKPLLHLNQYPHITFDFEINVKMKKLDDFIEENKDLKISINNYNFICLDVQGFELEVLKGCQQTLKNIDYILCEVHRDELYENCCKVDQIDKYLNQFNFNRVETTWDGGIWGDAFYIKEQLN
jgi:FkbM family methyltransferase